MKTIESTNPITNYNDWIKYIYEQVKNLKK